MLGVPVDDKRSSFATTGLPLNSRNLPSARMGYCSSFFLDGIERMVSFRDHVALNHGRANDCNYLQLIIWSGSRATAPGPGTASAKLPQQSLWSLHFTTRLFSQAFFGPWILSGLSQLMLSPSKNRRVKSCALVSFPADEAAPPPTMERHSPLPQKKTFGAHTTMLHPASALHSLPPTNPSNRCLHFRRRAR